MEEHEQVEALRRWWDENAKVVIIALAALLAVVVSWQQWQVHQRTQAMAASDAYQQMLNQLADPAKTIEAGRALVTDYPRSEYAVLASLAMAAAAVQQNDLDAAAAHLRFAMNNGKMPGDQQIAALRLARVLIAQQKTREAQKVVDATKSEGFEGEFDEVRGDIALALGDRMAARNAYQEAVNNYAGQSAKLKVVKMKLDDLADAGGGK